MIYLLRAKDLLLLFRSVVVLVIVYSSVFSKKNVLTIQTHTPKSHI